MQMFNFEEIIDEQARGERLYLEFLRQPTMSMGLYALPAGGSDPQQPHKEDEVYYVVKGRGQITVGTESRPVQPGSLVFVAAHEPHQFHDIKEDLKLLVFFAPPETGLD